MNAIHESVSDTQASRDHESKRSGKKISGNYGYPRQLRLLTAGDFLQVFDQVDVKASSRTMTLLARLNHLGHGRLGFIIAKKNIKHAVSRNRIKRLAKEYFRHHQAEIPALDIVLLARKGTDDMDNAAINQELKRLFSKLIKKSNPV